MNLLRGSQISISSPQQRDEQDSGVDEQDQLSRLEPQVQETAWEAGWRWRPGGFFWSFLFGAKLPPVYFVQAYPTFVWCKLTSCLFCANLPPFCLLQTYLMFIWFNPHFRWRSSQSRPSILQGWNLNSIYICNRWDQILNIIYTKGWRTAYADSDSLSQIPEIPNTKYRNTKYHLHNLKYQIQIATHRSGKTTDVGSGFFHDKRRSSLCKGWGCKIGWINIRWIMTIEYWIWNMVEFYTHGTHCFARGGIAKKVEYNSMNMEYGLWFNDIKLLWMGLRLQNRLNMDWNNDDIRDDSCHLVLS